MSEFESKSTEHCCKNCKWCDISNTIAICRKFKKAVSFARTTCLEDEERWKSEEIAEKDLYKLSDNLIDELRKYADNPPLISLNHKLRLLEAKYEAVEAYIPKLEEIINKSNQKQKEKAYDLAKKYPNYKFTTKEIVAI